LLEVNGVRILIDCGPDFREQMIRLNDFKPIDAVLITHEHYDHVGGLDDLRPFCRFRDIPVYAEAYMVQHLRERIPYCFATNPYPGVPRITLEEVQPGKPFVVSNAGGAEVEILPVRVMHGRLPILGYRIGNLAWITDMLTMSESVRERWLRKAVTKRVLPWWEFLQKSSKQKNNFPDPGLKMTGIFL
jgi:phosphoribosyl 1,2-cyclic phosphate phosphodiesterase